LGNSHSEVIPSCLLFPCSPLRKKCVCVQSLGWGYNQRAATSPCQAAGCTWLEGAEQHPDLPAVLCVSTAAGTLYTRCDKGAGISSLALRSVTEIGLSLAYPLARLFLPGHVVKRRGCLTNRGPHPSKPGCVSGSLSLSHTPNNPQPMRKDGEELEVIHHCPSLSRRVCGAGELSHAGVKPGHLPPSFFLLQAAKCWITQIRISTPPPVDYEVGMEAAVSRSHTHKQAEPQPL